jgi:hypothetical protein
LGSVPAPEFVVSAEKFMQRGINPVEGTAVATFEGKTITSLNYISHFLTGDPLGLTIKLATQVGVHLARQKEPAA